MLGRVAAIALNTYREAIRARLLLAMLALALATSAYSVVIGTLSLHHETRVIADVGSASTSLYAIIAAVVLGATSLHREIELKTIFPILARPVRRHEYLVGKYLGTMATLASFVLIDMGLVLALLALEAGASVASTLGLLGGLVVVLALWLWRARFTRAFVLLPWSVVFAVAMAFVSSPAGPDRQLVLLSAVLTVAEVSIVSAVATLFSSFSSPFLTAVFTFGVVLVGQSADTLAHLPPKTFGEVAAGLAHRTAAVVPNLQVYVPPRALLVGDVSGVSLSSFVLGAAAHAAAYAIALVAIAVFLFQRRDFQ